MKTTLYPIVLMAYAVATSQSGEFVNLTFDEPDLSHVVNPEGMAMAPVGEALRGWTIEWEKPGLAPLEWIGVKYGGAPLGLIEMGFGSWGAYTLFVHGYWSPQQDDFGPLRPTLHLYQVGTIPADASQLRLFQSGFWVGMTQPVITYIDGQAQYEVGMPGVPAFTCIDVSAFAGQEVKLEFVFPSGPNQFHSFDIFGFVAIPEPSVLVLLAGGGFGLWLARRRGLGAGRGG